MASELREDLISSDLATEPQRVIVRQQFLAILGRYQKRTSGKSKTPGQAKDLPGVFDLIRRAVRDFEQREETSEKYRLEITEESPDFAADLETLSFSLVKSEPGAFAAGRPFESDIKSFVPVLREEVDDPEHPGYRIAILGYWYDSIIRLTVFSRTNKRANKRVEWLQGLMQDYMWFFRSSGVNRIFFWKRGEDFVIENNGAKLYGRPLDFFVRTESIRQLREKTLEMLEIDTGLLDNGSTLNPDLLND